MATDAELVRLRPSDGARYLLERDGDDAAVVRAVYRAWILAPDAAYLYRIELAAGEDPVLAADCTAPEALEKVLRTFAKLTARDGAPWPARVLRWRGPGRQASPQSSSSS